MFFKFLINILQIIFHHDRKILNSNCCRYFLIFFLFSIANVTLHPQINYDIKQMYFWWTRGFSFYFLYLEQNEIGISGFIIFKGFFSITLFLVNWNLKDWTRSRIWIHFLFTFSKIFKFFIKIFCSIKRQFCKFYQNPRRYGIF